MNGGELEIVTARMLSEARALRDAFPDLEAMSKLPVSPLPPVDGGPTSGLLAALECLRDEMLVVRDGRAGELIVLEDEIACVERFLARP